MSSPSSSLTATEAAILHHPTTRDFMMTAGDDDVDEQSEPTLQLPLGDEGGDSTRVGLVRLWELGDSLRRCVADVFEAAWPHRVDECDAIRRGLYTPDGRPTPLVLVPIPLDYDDDNNANDVVLGYTVIYPTRRRRWGDYSPTQPAAAAAVDNDGDVTPEEESSAASSLDCCTLNSVLVPAHLRGLRLGQALVKLAVSGGRHELPACLMLFYFFDPKHCNAIDPKHCNVVDPEHLESVAWTLEHVRVVPFIFIGIRNEISLSLLLFLERVWWFRESMFDTVLHSSLQFNRGWVKASNADGSKRQTRMGQNAPGGADATPRCEWRRKSWDTDASPRCASPKTSPSTRAVGSRTTQRFIAPRLGRV